MAGSSEQLVRNQLLLREVNERLAEIVHPDGSGEFLCECGCNDCTETLQLPLRVYKIVHSSPNLFLILPGHESGEIERVIKTSDTFTLVETKRTDLALAPRRETPPSGV